MRAASNLNLAHEEAACGAAASARTKMVERVIARSAADERSRTDRERLEMIARGKPNQT